MPLNPYTENPRYLRMHESDNVAVVVNDGGVSPGARFDDGLEVRDSIPQAHKVALTAIAEGEAVLRYGQVIGTARRDIPPGSSVRESDLILPTLLPIVILLPATELTKTSIPRAKPQPASSCLFARRGRARRAGPR